MEEIDIIELFKRVKEGKAPKRIEIDYKTCEINKEGNTIDTLYETCDGTWLEDLFVDFDTKIRILDKPIIEELSDDDMLQRRKVKEKINEIIRYLRSRDER